MLDEPTNHLDVDAKALAHELPAHLPRRAARHQPRPRAARPGDHPHPAPRRGRADRIQGHVFAVPRRRARPTRNGGPSSRRVRSRRSSGSSTLADSMRHQTAKPRAHRQGARHARRAHARRNRSQAAKAERTLRVKLPDPPRAGRIVLEVDDLAKAFGPKVVFEDVSFDVGRGERLLVLGLNGAGKTTLLRSLVGELEPELGEVAARPSGVDGLLRAGARRHPARPHGASSTSARSRALADQYLRGLLGMFGLRGDLVVPGRGHAVGRREDQARARDARDRRRTTCCCSTSRRTTSTRRRARRSVRRCASGRARW